MQEQHLGRVSPLSARLNLFETKSLPRRSLSLGGPRGQAKQAGPGVNESKPAGFTAAVEMVQIRLLPPMGRQASRRQLNSDSGRPFPRRHWKATPSPATTVCPALPAHNLLSCSVGQANLFRLFAHFVCCFCLKVSKDRADVNRYRLLLCSFQSFKGLGTCNEVQAAGFKLLVSFRQFSLQTPRLH